MSDFVVPSFVGDLDVAAQIEAAPESGTVRGMFLQEVVGAVSGEDQPSAEQSYIAFKNYPLREYLRVLADGARTRHPDQPLRAGLRALGTQVYGNFVQTMVGSAIFAFAGEDFANVLARAGKAYGVAMRPGTVKTLKLGPSRARLEMRSIWPFPDCFQFGVLEGAMREHGVEGQLKLRMLSRCDVDYDIEWD